jgi:hypothetical protein
MNHVVPIAFIYLKSSNNPAWMFSIQSVQFSISRLSFIFKKIFNIIDSKLEKQQNAVPCTAPIATLRFLVAILEQVHQLGIQRVLGRYQLECRVSVAALGNVPVVYNAPQQSTTDAPRFVNALVSIGDHGKVFDLASVVDFSAQTFTNLREDGVRMEEYVFHPDHQERKVWCFHGDCFVVVVVVVIAAAAIVEFDIFGVPLVP